MGDLLPSRKLSRSESSAEPRLRSAKRRAAQLSSPPLSPRFLRDTPPPSPPSDAPLESLESRPLLALSCANVQRLEEAMANHSPTNRSPTNRSPSPTRTVNNLEAREKLAAFKVHVDAQHALDPDLAAHIASVIRRPRAADVPISPNAKKTVAKRAGAARQNEDTGISRLEPHLLFRGEADQCDMVAVTTLPHISSKSKVYLNKGFLPKAPNATIKSIWSTLAGPVPDTCIGYVTRADAMTAPASAPFTAEQEQTLHSFAVAQSMHFPFLTSQWKSPNSNENLTTAANQSARDGAVIVNHLHEFYAAAYPDRAPSVVDTCHFSVTSDLNYLEIWVHWRANGSDEHHMEQVDNFSLRKEEHVREARSLLRNIADYAVGDRLAAIKAAIPSFAESQLKGQVRPILPPESTAPSSSASATSGRLLNFMFPMTPNSTGSGSVMSEPVKKRPRLGE
ncbi:hypothetical protein K458DRAFT_436363 [Lentithecium fluviatile CBS 122367]|uniref:DUF7924 domain-containing protein n=1 Tax=Lentithecium fluviatile CBS 122367 TaxID=1168545 RepID=A0A6G1IHL6_9PLEO|nr:hypothetical protein K458DRAFT_436363 [Lentithecium fluviatile CBS 122367]